MHHNILCPIKRMQILKNTTYSILSADMRATKIQYIVKPDYLRLNFYPNTVIVVINESLL